MSVGENKQECRKRLGVLKMKISKPATLVGMVMQSIKILAYSV